MEPQPRAPIAPLQTGERVAIIAPSSPFDRPRFQRGVDALRSLNLEVKFDEQLFSRWPEGEHAYLAGDDERRLSELLAALRDPGARLLVLARGGYGAMRIAEALSPAEIAASNKLLLGYSDATVLHLLWAQAGLPSLHGPMCTQLGEDPSALDRLRALLFGIDPGPIRWDPIRLPGHPVRLPEHAAPSPDLSSSSANGLARGILRGGNLATLASLCGTKLAPRFDGCIVLLEDLNEPPYRLDRLCTQLLQSGAMAGARGVVVGDLWGSNESSQGRAEVLAERFAPLGIPLAFGAPFGHAGRNQPVAFGCLHELDAGGGTLTPLEMPTGARGQA